MKYNRKFYTRGERRKHAFLLSDEIKRLVNPKSVVDVGCGVGHLLSFMTTDDILGIDSTSILPDDLMIPPDKFNAKDLNVPFHLKRKFDLCICLEVAEHLSHHRSYTFIQDLCKLSDTILFSAAIPGQGGVHHVMEQWQSFWVNIFEQHGFKKYDCIRFKLWNTYGLPKHYKQNMFFFVKGDTHLTDTDAPTDIVHPLMYRHESLKSIPLRRAFGTILYIPVILYNKLTNR